MRLLTRTHLADAERAAVLDLIGRATDHDDRSPLSEQGMLHVRPAPVPGVTHLLATADSLATADDLCGYAQLDARPGGAPAAELVVAPAVRRRGHGGALLDAALAAQPSVRVWAHGVLPGTAELAASRGLEPVRELLKLGRALQADDDFDTRLPPGYTLTTYRPQDATQWLTVNAAAFADHPEQGRMTLTDLREREAEPWFDPAGLFLVRDEQGRLAASHWTKVEDGVGEVYVVAVAPDHQGLGLGRSITAIGLAHLREMGLSRVELYVDGDNSAAIATYRAQGFRTLTRDVQYAAPMSR